MRRRLMQSILPWVTTVLSLVVTVMVFTAARSALERRTEDRLAVFAGDVATSLGAGIDRYADVLRAVDGLITGSEDVTPDEFAAFVDALRLPERYAGAEAVTRVGRSTPGGPIVVQASVGIHPAPIGAELDAGLSSTLDDLLATPSELDTTVMSTPFPPPSGMSTAATADTRHVVLVHHAQPDGWLLVWFDATAFVADIGAAPAGYALEVRDVTDGTAAGELVGRAGTTFEPEHTASADLTRFGRHWRVTVDHVGALESAAERDEPWILLAGGLLLTVGLATTFLIQSSGRRQALELAARASHSERVRRDLIESAPVAIIEVDERGVVRSWNSAASALIGTTADDAIGKPLDLPVDDAVRRIGLSAAFAGLGGGRLTLATPQGERVVTAFTKCDDLRHQVLILVDETVNVALSRQLEQAQKLEVFGRLSGGIAHDFNNLLTPILGYIDLVLLRSRLDDTDRGALQEARRAADRAAMLVTKLLAVSRPPTGAAVALDVGRTIEELAGLLTAAAGADVVRVDAVADRADRPYVRIDRTQLEQVLLNLVLNAHEAMDRPGHIGVSLSADASTVTIRVVDDGHGMDATTQAAMFEPFFSTKLDRGGSGLGLATVYSIVTGAGGSIMVESEPGRGTRIDVSFPRAEPDPTAESSPSAPGGEVGAAATILLVEDDPAVRRLATTILRDHDFDVVPVTSADEAMDALARLDGTVDVVLTDVVLRGTSGTELAARLHARRPDLVVLFMSGYTDGHFGTAGELPAGTRLLPKPFRVDELLGFVREALDGSS